MNGSGYEQVRAVRHLDQVECSNIGWLLSIIVIHISIYICMNIITLNIHTLDSFTPVCLGAPTVHTPVKKNKKTTKHQALFQCPNLNKYSVHFKSLIPFDHLVIKKTYLFAQRKRIIVLLSHFKMFIEGLHAFEWSTFDSNPYQIFACLFQYCFLGEIH